MTGTKVDIESLSDFEIERPFMKQGWLNLLDMGNEVFPKYVRMFFANMSTGWEAGGLFTVKSKVGGRDVVLNEVIIGEIFGIPHVGIRAYELKTWPVCKGFDYGAALSLLLGADVAEDAPRKIHANQLPVRLRLLHLICTHNLMPRGGHREEVTYMDVFVLERLLKEKKFNLPYIMLKHMEAACAPKKNLPYGLLFTQIFRHFGVALSSREQDTLTKSELFDTHTLTRMGYRRTSRNTWVPKHQASDEDEPEEADEEFEDVDEPAEADEDLEAEDELAGEEVDAEAMEFDIDADLADDPPFIPSPTSAPDHTFSLESRFTAFEHRMDSRFTTFEQRMDDRHEAQQKFLHDSVTSMQEEQRRFFEDMRTFMARFPPPS
jgi:hypothetical protein